MGARDRVNLSSIHFTGTAVWAVPNLAALPDQCPRHRVSHRGTSIPIQPGDTCIFVWSDARGKSSTLFVCNGCICPGRKHHAFLVVSYGELEIFSDGHGSDSYHIYRWMGYRHFTFVEPFTRSISGIC